MPALTKHIDVIAREKQRTVLYIEFHPKNWGIFSSDVEEEIDESWQHYEYLHDQRRNDVLAWLDENGIPWQKCGPVASEYSFRSYLGEVYIDVPFDDNDQQYLLLRDYLENPDGTMRDENVRFYYLPLEKAMENAHHDEPGFWEKWTEEF